MAGIRPLDYEDPEKDPEYAAALERYYAANFDAPGAAEYRAAGAPARPADVGGIRVRPAAMLADMAKGTNGDAAPKPTPGGEALYADLQRAAEGPSLLDRASGAAADLMTSPSLRARMAAGEDTPRLNEALSTLGDIPVPAMVGGPTLRDAVAPLGRLRQYLPAMAGGTQLPESAERPAAPVPAAAPPTPPQPQPTPPMARSPVSRPRTEMAREVTTPNVTRIASAAPPVPSGDITPDHPAVRRIVEEASSRTRVAPDTATAGPSDLESALQESSQRRLLAGLTRAGATAVGGGRGPAYDALDEGADRPLQELALRRADAAQQQGREAQAADADPASPQSQMARALAARVAPGLEREPWFQDASYTSLSRGPLGKMLEQAGGIQRERIKAQAQVDKATAKARGAGAGVREADVQKLGKDTEGLAQIGQDLATLDQAINTEGDIPGAGILDTRKPGWMQSPDDIAVRQAANRVAARLLFEQSGASVTPQEAERFMEGRGMGRGATEEQFKAGVRALNSELRAALEAKKAKYSKPVQETLRQRGGFLEFPASAGGAQDDAAAVAWARANPNDPRAKRILELNR